MIIKKINIDESNVINEDLLLSHIAIDYILASDQYELFEKYGVYNGCKELVNYIYNKVIKKYKQNYILIKCNIKENEISKFDNVFFNELFIKINISDNISTGGYVNDRNKKLNKEKKNDFIEFEFNINKSKFETDLKSLLYHELTHAYQEYCMLITNKDNLYNSLEKQHYDKLLVGKSSYDNIKQIISDILYHINKTEQHAYIAELKSDLENNKDKIHGPQEALNIIKKSIVYQNIMQAKDILYGLTDNSYSKEIQEKIYDVYRELNECDWTNNKIKKKLINQIDKYISKVEKIIPKMCLDFLENNTIEIKEDHHRKIINLKDYLKNECIS
jgi:hypothetical protein